MLPYSNVITKIYDEKDTVAGQYNDCLENFLGKKRLYDLYRAGKLLFFINDISSLCSKDILFFGFFFSFKLMMDNLFFEYKIKCQ